MIVGHLPFLQKLASLALTGLESQEIVSFCMGGVVCVERGEDSAWRLVFEVVPSLLK